MRAAIHIIIVASFLFFVELARSEYSSPRMFEMAGGAELIVSGEIETVGERTYVLHVERVLGGEHSLPQVEIVKFVDWPCSWRHAPYEKGQRLVAFLRREPAASESNEKPIYRTMSAGCEGEIPIQGEFAYCYLVPCTSELMCATIGRHERVFKTPVENLHSAIEGYRALYRVTLGDGRVLKKDGFAAYVHATAIQRVHAPGSEAPFRPRRAPETPLSRLESFARRSYLHRYLIDTTERVAPHLGATSVGWKASTASAAPEVRIINYKNGEGR